MVAICPLLLALVSFSAVCANPDPEPGGLDGLLTDVVGSLLTGKGGSGGCEEGGLLGVVDNLVDDLLGGGGDGCDGDGGGLVGDLLGGLLGGGGGGGGRGGKKGKGGGGGGLIEGVDELLGGVLNVVDDLLGDGISINVGAGGGQILGVDVGDLVDLSVGGGGCGCGKDDHSVQLELLGNVLDLTLGGDGNIKNNRGSLLNLDVLDGLIDIGVGNGGGGGRRRRGGRNLGNKNCYNVDTIHVSVNDHYCDQPLFVNFLPKTEAHTLIDNVCYTFFPLPDDPFTFNLYRATVFCDGSSRVETAIITEFSTGRSRIADPFCTMSANVIGYAGCDTYVVYRCMEFGECACENTCPNIIGLSASCAPLGLSCIQKVEEIIDSTCLPRPDFVILPMKLSNRCVTQQICINNIKGNFFRALNLPAPGPVPVII